MLESVQLSSLLLLQCNKTKSSIKLVRCCPAGPSVAKMRETTKKQLDLQEVLFSRMVVRSEFVVQKHLQHAVQAAAGDLQKANISVAEATALLDYDKLEVMPTHSLLYKVDKYDKVSHWGDACLRWYSPA